MIQYTDEEVLAALVDVAERAGQAPTATQYRELQRDGQPTVRTIINRFEDSDAPWMAALDAAGLAPNPSRHLGYKWHDEAHVQGIIYVAAQDAEWPTGYRYQQVYREHDLVGLVPSKHTIQQEFGTWENAVEHAKQTTWYMPVLIEEGPTSTRHPDMPHDPIRDLFIREFGLVKTFKFHSGRADMGADILWRFLPGHSGREIIEQIDAAGGFDNLNAHEALRRMSELSKSHDISGPLYEIYGDDEWPAHWDSKDSR